MKRRDLLKQGGCAMAAIALPGRLPAGQGILRRVGGPHLRISCNLYSFDKLMKAGTLSLEEVLEICAGLGFDAVDPTGYYFPGYPALPPDDYLYRIKRRAFVLGLDISGTGVRNDFTQPEAAKRQEDLQLIRDWIGCAERLGATNLRVFVGRADPGVKNRGEVIGWVVEGLRQSVEYAARHGVMIALQNHWDFIRKADETLEILRRVNSEWLGVNLDIGSYRSDDPYEEIARVAPYAINWQVKEFIYFKERQVPVDLPRLIKIVKGAGYRGYLPLETLEGDPRQKMPKFIAAVRNALV